VSIARRLAAAAAARATTTVVRGLLDDEPPGGARRWERTNHRGEPVSLLGGPAVAAGVLAGGLVGAPSVRDGAALAVATSSAAAFGLVDDLTEDREGTVRKGLRGHLGALARGEVTTGGLKVLGIGAGALVAAALSRPHDRLPAGRGAAAAARLAVVAVDGALIAATANLVNLLDLRPGRALKAATIAAAPAALLGGRGGATSAAVVGAALVELPADLGERDMLGDSGANAVGAVLGTAAVQGCPRPVRLALLAGVVALTVASEKVSFTQVIARTPVLRELDAWGRRPAHEPAAGGAPLAGAPDEPGGSPGDAAAARGVPGR
jgi:UDP-N-acetylmuramyl pentapeptide phosphotransferase/UDP-N-acetylglucosamine-1-phosphate transferase